MTIRQDDKELKRELKGTKTNKFVKERVKPKKELNVLATRYLDEFLSPKRLDAFGSCGEWLEFAVSGNYDAAKVLRGNFCNHRFCPMCNMRKSFKDAKKIEILLRALEEKEGQEFIFLTLTIPNCKGDELASKLDEMNKAVKKMFMRKRLIESTNGYIRKVEVTTDQTKKISQRWYNKREEFCKRKGLKVGDENPNFNTFHPHMHFIIAVDKEYFKSKSKLYITQEEWTNLWREISGYENAVVDVRKVQERTTSNAIVEIAKYSAKDNDLYQSKSVFMTFLVSLRGRQLLTFNGYFKDYVKMYKSGELDSFIDCLHDDRREAQRRNGEQPIIYEKVMTGLWKLMLTKKQNKIFDYALKIRDMTEDEFNEINDCRDVELAKKMSGKE